jgi:hypothetical protein
MGGSFFPVSVASAAGFASSMRKMFAVEAAGLIDHAAFVFCERAGPATQQLTGFDLRNA